MNIKLIPFNSKVIQNSFHIFNRSKYFVCLIAKCTAFLAYAVFIISKHANFQKFQLFLKQMHIMQQYILTALLISKNDIKA